MVNYWNIKRYATFYLLSIVLPFQKFYQPVGEVDVSGAGQEDDRLVDDLELWHVEKRSACDPRSSVPLTPACQNSLTPWVPNKIDPYLKNWHLVLFSFLRKPGYQCGIFTNFTSSIQIPLSLWEINTSLPIWRYWTSCPKECCAQAMKHLKKTKESGNSLKI